MHQLVYERLSLIDQIVAEVLPQVYIASVLAPSDITNNKMMFFKKPIEKRNYSTFEENLVKDG